MIEVGPRLFPNQDHGAFVRPTDGSVSIKIVEREYSRVLAGTRIVDRSVSAAGPLQPSHQASGNCALLIRQRTRCRPNRSRLTTIGDGNARFNWSYYRSECGRGST